MKQKNFPRGGMKKSFISRLVGFLFYTIYFQDSQCIKLALSSLEGKKCYVLKLGSVIDGSISSFKCFISAQKKLFTEKF